MMRMHNNTPRFADPVAEKCAAGRSLHRSNLLGTIDLFYVQAALGLLAWPSKSATPTQVIRSEGGAHLLRHGGGLAATAELSPVLAVCSLVSRPYVLDLLPGRSVVQALQRAGREVGLLDWARSRRRRMRSASITTRSGSSRARLILCICTPAPRRTSWPLHGRHAVAACARWRREGAEPRDDGHAGRASLRLFALAMDPRVFFLAMEQWLEDFVAFSGRALVQRIGLHQKNAPMQAQVTVGDSICRWATSRRPSSRGTPRPTTSLGSVVDGHRRPRPRTRCTRCSRWNVGTWSRRRARRRAERVREPWRQARKQRGADEARGRLDRVPGVAHAGQAGGRGAAHQPSVQLSRARWSRQPSRAYARRATFTTGRVSPAVLRVNAKA